MTEYICRICGFVYDTPTWMGPGSASFDICNCCGVEFGIQDCLVDGVREYRKYWLDNGGEWFWPKRKPSGEWNLQEQLRNIPPEWV